MVVLVVVVTNDERCVMGMDVVLQQRQHHQHQRQRHQLSPVHHQDFEVILDCSGSGLPFALLRH